jgi:hypothetical protein
MLERFLRSAMDTRVKPAYDELGIEAATDSRAVASAAALFHLRCRLAILLAILAGIAGLRQNLVALRGGSDPGDAGKLQ